MTTNWKLVSPNGIVIDGFASERDATNKARELNKARHWSKRWVVSAEAA